MLPLKNKYKTLQQGFKSMKNKKIDARTASLETRVDLLEAELSYLNKILIQCGFQEGIATLKEAAEELLREEALKIDNLHRS
jgi:hypothetical protein